MIERYHARRISLLQDRLEAITGYRSPFTIGRNMLPRLACDLFGKDTKTTRKKVKQLLKMLGTEITS